MHATKTVSSNECGLWVTVRCEKEKTGNAQSDVLKSEMRWSERQNVAAAGAKQRKGQAIP